MGLDPAMVSSPTFVLMHEYVRDDAGAPPLVHVDAYRITGPEDLETLALEQAADAAVVIIEWPERIGAALPAGTLAVHIEHAGDPDSSRRLLRFDASGAWRDRLAPLRADTIGR
jgi:tRNA threonylcarbamoyl adenosine modification protein YjeE